MPPFILPPLVKWTLSAFGVAAMAHWVVKEVRRLNAEVDDAEPMRVREPVRLQELPTLRRDPRTGEYHL